MNNDMTTDGNGVTTLTSKMGNTFIRYSNAYKEDMKDIWGIDMDVFLRNLIDTHEDLWGDVRGQLTVTMGHNMGDDGKFSVTWTVKPKSNEESKPETKEAIERAM